MRIDYNDLASPMELDENYIKGELWQPVKTWKWLWNKKAGPGASGRYPDI